ncbi:MULTISPECIES: hypothetical protein [unclassified Burkholderia]|uniref:hypothetical protein n=1 Tax=unclassified Burkholderia TaxID=2613784 RepID=UPI002AAF26C7|nr:MULTISPECIES: hypothetical protein [unclassified Burkholderia]
MNDAKDDQTRRNPGAEAPRKRGIIRGTARMLFLPYARSWDSVGRIGRALTRWQAAANSESRRETDDLAKRTDKPVAVDERFTWYCRELGLTEEKLAERAAYFEFVRRVAVVATAVSLIGGALTFVMRSWLFSATDLMVAVTFAVVALRNAFYLFQIRERRILTWRDFIARPDLFKEWFAWRSR